MHAVRNEPSYCRLHPNAGFSYLGPFRCRRCARGEPPERDAEIVQNRKAVTAPRTGRASLGAGTTTSRGRDPELVEELVRLAQDFPNLVRRLPEHEVLQIAKQRLEARRRDRRAVAWLRASRGW
jgi:hypothetical protein